jgi:hypothetical protein
MDLPELIKEAVPWVFSGIGVFIISVLIKGKVDKWQKQNIKKNSIGYQAGGDININQEKKSGHSKPEN